MPNRKEHTPGTDKVRRRFIEAMFMVIAQGKIRNRKLFSERINIDPQRVNNIETKGGVPTTENLIDLCKEFKVSPGWLLLGRGEMFSKEESNYLLEELKKLVHRAEKKK